MPIPPIQANTAEAPGPPHRTSRLIAGALVLSLLAAAVAGFHCWSIQQQRTALGDKARPLELDGWGHRVLEQKEHGRSLAGLLRKPSLWKGPVVPFLFGLAYYLAPFDESVLIFNVACFALSVGCLFMTLRLLGVGWAMAAAPLLLWMGYLPHAVIFGYYFAEPVLGLFSSVLMLVMVFTIRKQSGALSFAGGMAAGLLLLARAPFLLTVAGLPVVLWCHCKRGRAMMIGFFTLGFVVVFSPWVTRNYLTYGELIPFTTDGGKVMFQGTFLPGDAVGMSKLRQNDQFARIEEGERGMTAIERYQYWRSLAKEQVLENPVGQLRLIVRKGIRFWMYLPQHSWVPRWKTTTVAAIFLPLALIGCLTGYRRLAVQLAALWVGGLWAVHALIHSELRYNFPVLPLMFFLAMIGANWVRVRLGIGHATPKAKIATTPP